MLFNTWGFALFFAVVFAVYHRVAPRPKRVLLLVASYYFYGSWDWRFLGLLALSTFVDYFAGLRIADAPTPRARRRWLLLSLGVNLGILCFFKYCNFFVGSAAVLLGRLGFEAHLPTLHIILPVGISFYTFQTMAYTIDVYRGRLPATRDPILFALYVAYFPQLVAGPIERAEALIPQLEKPARVTADGFASGLVLILVGLLRKVVIADNAARFADAVFSDPAAYGSLDVLRGVLLFGLQIYGDFAGYSDMARGTSRLLGIELMRNFEHPYFATSITDFWRRWHISLSTWLRDYLYIPLGGNRGRPSFVYRNLLLTMLLGGLWHGAAWTFVVWGALHGVALAFHKLWTAFRERHGIRAAPAPVAWAATMALVFVGWVFFRAPDFPAAFRTLEAVVVWSGAFHVSKLAVVAALVALMLLIDVPQHLTGSHSVFLRWPWAVRGVFYAAAILLILVFHISNVPFIYFQF